jgi:hypothetical protein
LAKRLQSDGYVKVHLCVIDDGTKHEVYPRLHRLVAEAFCVRPAGTTEVDHINGIRKDNRACNLRWVTRAQNQRAIKQRKGLRRKAQDLRLPSGGKGGPSVAGSPLFLHHIAPV